MSIGVNSLSSHLGYWEFPASAPAGSKTLNRRHKSHELPTRADTIAHDEHGSTDSSAQPATAVQGGNMTVADDNRNGQALEDTTEQTYARSSERDVDQVLVERVQQGDTRAFDALVIKYQQRVIQLVARLVHDADAPDVAQEAFIKAYRALPNFRGQSAFYTWLYRIAINTAKNHLVARKRRPSDQDIDIQDAELYGHTEALSDVATPEANLLTEEIRQIVQRTIAALPADLRTAISLREFDGLSYEEIAEAMDCPVGTVRSRIFRARAAVDEQLKPLLEQV